MQRSAFTHKVRSLLIAGSLALATLTVPFTSANAVVANPEIRLVSPVINGDNSWNGQSLADDWIGKGWFHEGLTFRQTWAPVGSKIVLTYYVTNSENDLPLANQNVTLRVNKAWSVSNGLVQVNGSATTSGVERSNGTDQLRVVAKTDPFGYVTFVLQDMLSGTVAGEPEPESFTVRGHDYDIDSGGDPMVSYYTQLLPEIMGEKSDLSDLIEFHFYRPNADDNPDLSTTTARVIAPAMTETSSIHRTDLETEVSVTNNWYAPGVGFYQRYAATGSKTNFVYNVTDANGDPIRNHSVTLSVGKAYSSSNAKVTDGTTATNLGAAADADQAQWTGTTDAFGNVLFGATNTDTSGIAKPATVTTPVPETNSKYSQFWLNVADSGVSVGDIVELHFYTAPKVAQVIPTVAKTFKKGKTLIVPLKTNRGIAITWSSLTPKLCKKTAANKFLGLATGTCKLKGTNKGNTTSLPITFTKLVKIVK